MDQIHKKSKGVFKAMKDCFLSLTNLIFLMVLITNVGCSVFGVRSVEEAHYSVKFVDDDKEIRGYAPRIIARTTVSGAYKEAQREAFRILADYIFGKNISKQEIAMTAPVTQEAGTDIAMTAPVTQQKSSEGWSMTFAMPSKYKSLDDLPKPVDERIELIEKPEGLYAAIQFTWLTDEKKNNLKAKELLDWLEEKAQYKPISIPSYAGYDPPWTLPFFRRQEVMVEVEPVSSN